MQTPKRIRPSQRHLAITQTRSTIGKNQCQRDTIRSLGLRRIGHTVYRQATPETVGMINAVPHLVKVEYVEHVETER